MVFDPAAGLIVRADGGDTEQPYAGGDARTLRDAQVDERPHDRISGVIRLRVHLVQGQRPACEDFRLPVARTPEDDAVPVQDQQPVHDIAAFLELDHRSLGGRVDGGLDHLRIIVPAGGVQLHDPPVIGEFRLAPVIAHGAEIRNDVFRQLVVGDLLHKLDKSGAGERHVHQNLLVLTEILRPHSDADIRLQMRQVQVHHEKVVALQVHHRFV